MEDIASTAQGNFGSCEIQYKDNNVNSKIFYAVAKSVSRSSLRFEMHKIKH
jgi:hypothetical protein